MKHNRPVDYAIEEGLDDLYPPDFNPARTPSVEPDKKGGIWIWALLGGLALGHLVTSMVDSSRINDAVGAQQKAIKQLQELQHELKLEGSKTEAQIQTALNFTQYIQFDTVEAAKALYDCKQKRLEGFPCKAVIAEAQRLNLPVSATAYVKPREGAQ